MNRRPLLQAAAAVALLAAAGYLLYRQTLGRKDPGELGFFYDVSAGRIFTASRIAPPPIRGTDGPDEDGFRAVVISTTGKPADRASWKVAYLEKFSPELRQRTLEAQRSGESLTMGRMELQGHRFVRRVEDGDAAWHAMNTPEGEAIASAWATPGPEGITPVLCTP